MPMDTKGELAKVTGILIKEDVWLIGTWKGREVLRTHIPTLTFCELSEGNVA